MTLGVGVLAGRDAQVASRVVEAGACEAVVEALRQAMDRRDLDAVCLSNDSVQRLVAIPSGARQLALGGAVTCEVLVRSLRFALDMVAGRGPQAAILATLLPYWVTSWLTMMKADARCKQFFLAVSGEQALLLALDVPAVANDCAAVMLYRGTRDVMLSRPTLGQPSMQGR
eukprot:jgi/Mesvir1/15523/Mv03175-RA.1